MILITFFLLGSVLIEGLVDMAQALTDVIREYVRRILWIRKQRAARKRPVIW